MLNLGQRQEPPPTPPSPGWITVVDKAVPAVIAGVLLALLSRVNGLNETIIQNTTELSNCVDVIRELKERVKALEEREMDRANTRKDHK